MLKNNVRIIAGTLRRRLIRFPENAHIRPTPDRLRETLFNWLNPYLTDAVCLDSFAGSGILGFEAISRYAKHVTFIDQDPLAIKAIQQNAHELNIRNIDTLVAALPDGAKRIKTPFDIVFLDPPYGSQLIKTTLDTLEGNHLLKTGTLVYIEQSLHQTEVLDESKYKKIKEKHTKTILYGLFEYT